MLTKEFADKLNSLHERVNNSAKLAVTDAITIGGLLLEAVEEHGKKTLSAWLDAGNTVIARSVAYRYMDLYAYRDQIGESKNIFVAYKQIADFKADQKRIEYKQSADRVAEFKKTGVKPEGYKRMTDERRSKKLEAAQNPRWDSVPDIEKNNKVEFSIDEILENPVSENVTDALCYDEEPRNRSASWLKIFIDRFEYTGNNRGLIASIIENIDYCEDDNARIEACHDAIKVLNEISAALHE